MNWKFCLAILTCNVVLMSSSYTMLIPFLPMYLSRDLGADPSSINLWSGIVFSSSFAVSAVMAPIWGKMADTKGKRLMAIRASFLLAISYFLGGIVQTPFQLVLMRLFQGFAAGLWPMDLAIMTTVAPKDKLGLCLGVLQGALTSGIVIGPLLGGILAEVFGMRPSFFIAAGALMLNFLAFVFLIKEPETTDVTEAVTPTAAAPRKSLWKKPIIRDMLLYGIFVQMVILLVQPIMTTYVEELSHTTENILFISGLVFSLSGFSSAMAAPLWGKFGQRSGFHRSLTWALTLAGICAVIQSIPDTLYPFATAQFAIGLFFSGIYPSINAILAENTDAREKAKVFGLLFSAQQIGSMAGPLLGGVIATVVGMKYVFLVAGLILLSISLSVRYRKYH